MDRPISNAARTDAVVQPLLRAFHAQRPLRAGSLLVTIFGDSVAPRGGEIALASLIELARPFGLSERLVRTSIGRLAREEWLASARIGRLSYYRLAEAGYPRFAAATQRIYSPPADEWRGSWTVLLMPELAAAERESIAEEFRWRGFGCPMPGVLVFPGDRVSEAREALGKHASGERVLTLLSKPAMREGDWLLARCAWNLTDLEQRYRRFVRSFEPVARAAQRASVEPVSCFVVRTLLIHEYRRIHLRDPLLPAALLPASWTGGAAYELCRMLYGSVFRAAEEFLTAHAVNREGPLPAADAEALHRFGAQAR